MIYGSTNKRMIFERPAVTMWQKGIDLTGLKACFITTFGRVSQKSKISGLG